MRAKHVKYEEDGKIWKEQIHFMCPGCGHVHSVSPAVHKFNGDLEKPTFSPSVLCNWIPGKCCHSMVLDGKIQFLNDCDHALKGQTVDLPEII